MRLLRGVGGWRIIERTWNCYGSKNQSSCPCSWSGHLRWSWSWLNSGIETAPSTERAIFL